MQTLTAQRARAATRWLRADVRDVVRVVPEEHARRVRASGRHGLRHGLSRWSGRLARRRAIVLGRRYFLIGAAAATLAELIAALAITGARPVWLIAPLLLTLAVAAWSVLRGVPAIEAAHLLDGGLALHDQIGTALELESSTPPAGGLASLVLDDANAALTESFGGARAVTRRSPGEWAWVLVAAAAVAGALAVPGASQSSSARPGSSTSAAAPAHARGGATSHASSQSAAAESQASSQSSAPAPSLPFQGTLNSKLGAATGDPYYGHAFALTAAQVAQLEREGLGASGHTARTLGVSGGPVPGSGGASGAGLSLAASGNAAGAGGLAGLGGGALPPPSSTSSAQSGSSPLGGHGGGASTTARGLSAALGGGYSGHSPGGASGGETAGNALAALNLGLGLVPDLTGQLGLPLQAGYAPAGSGPSSGQTAASEIPNGGGGPGRSAVGDASRSFGGYGTGFAVIPPTFNAVSTTSQYLLEGYFGTANQLNFAGW